MVCVLGGGGGGDVCKKDVKKRECGGAKRMEGRSTAKREMLKVTLAQEHQQQQQRHTPGGRGAISVLYARASPVWWTLSMAAPDGGRSWVGGDQTWVCCSSAVGPKASEAPPDGPWGFQPPRASLRRRCNFASETKHAHYSGGAIMFGFKLSDGIVCRRLFPNNP